MMCACRHIGQTSHHCGTKWCYIIFAQQMHHIANGDISLKNTAFYDIIKPKGVIRLKIHGVKREWSKPFWVRFKKHYCPTCMNLLTTTKVSKIVNSNSEEAKDYDFSSGDTYMIGNIKFIWTEFLCTACGKTYSLQEIRENEKKTK